METPDDLIARNIADLRAQRRHTVRSLSALLGKLGHPILPSGITKIEQRERRVNVGDLVALAIALGVNPNRLLLPVDDPRAKVALTPTVEVAAFQAWAWARGDQVLLRGYIEVYGDGPAGEAQDDFRRHALPPAERLRDDHTAVRAARDVLDSVRAVLDRREHPDEYVDENDPFFRAAGVDGPTSTAAGLRRALARLLAEVDALIGGDDG